jgi:hypothetical protein
MNNDAIDPVSVLYLAIFLVFVFALGYLIVRIKQARLARAWRPLLPIVQGRVIPSSGGGADSPMRGTYKGYSVYATMIPDASDGEDSRYNHFAVGLTGLAGREDWKVAYVHHLWPLTSPPTWQLECKDPATLARLQAAGVMKIIEDLVALPDAPDPPLSYAAARGNLLIQTVAGPGWIPTEARFIELLEGLITLARINAEANASASRSTTPGGIDARRFS